MYKKPKAAITFGFFYSYVVVVKRLNLIAVIRKRLRRVQSGMGLQRGNSSRLRR